MAFAAASFKGWHRHLATIAVLTTVLVGAAALRLSSLQCSYFHPDEAISLGVAGTVALSGELDTNWKRAPLPPAFRYPQYNFSAYLLTGAAVLKMFPGAWSDVPASVLGALRWWSAVLGVAVVALVYLLGRQLHGSQTGLLAAALAVVAPLLYQDSLYARPETFVTALTLAYAYLLGVPRSATRVRVVLVSAILGVLVATKISLLLLLPVAALIPSPDEPGRPPPAAREALEYVKTCVARFGRQLPLVLAGGVLGFAAGAPFALANPGDFLEGIRRLATAYAEGNWPHGLPGAGALARLAYAGAYFTATHGHLLFVFAIVGAGAAFRDRNFRSLGLVLVATAITLRFGTYPTFFERNLSHVLPFFIIAGAHGISWCADRVSRTIPKPLTASVLLVAVAYPAARCSFDLRFRELSGDHLKQAAEMVRRFESTYRARVAELDFARTFSDVEAQLGGNWPSLLLVRHPGDALTTRTLDELKARAAYQELAVLPSLFEHVPPSTLHTYFLPRLVLLHRDGKEGREGAADPSVPRR